MSKTQNPTVPRVAAKPAEIVREFGPFPGADTIHGVTHDGHHVWAAVGDRLIALDTQTGGIRRTLPCAGDAGTAFDGTFIYQIAEARISYGGRGDVSRVQAPPVGQALAERFSPF